MTKAVRRLMLLTTIAAVATGCSFVKHSEIEKEASRIATKYDSLLAEFKDKQAIRVPKSEPLVIARKSAFLYHEIKHDYANLGFRSVLKTLFPGMPLVYDMNIPADFNPRVVAPPDAYLVKDHLDAIAVQTNLGWSIQNGVLYISPNHVVHYPIPLFGSSSSDGGEGIKTTMAVLADNLGGVQSSGFINRVEGDISAYDELAGLASSVAGAKICDESSTTSVENSVSRDGILAAPACYSLSGAGNILVISARPQAHALFSNAYNPWFKSVNTQVQITLKILMVDVTDIAQQSINPSMIRSAAISAASGSDHFDALGIDFQGNSQSFIAFDQSSNGLTFSFDEGSRFAGSQLIIQALNQVGKTYISKEEEFTTRNNQLNSFTVTEETPYLESVSISTTNTGSNSSTTAPTLKSNATITGSAINIVPTVTGDEIGLRIVINEKILGEREDYKISTNQTTIQGSRFGWTSSSSTFTPTLRDGEAVLLVSSQRKVFDIDSAKNDFLPLVGDLRSAQGRVFNTMYLLEAHIIR